MQPTSHEEGFRLPYWICEIGQRIAILLTSIVSFAVFKIKIEGKENLKGLKTGTTFAMNHTSEWDSVILADCLGVFSGIIPLYTISREKEFYKEGKRIRSFFYGGNFFRFMGAFPVLVGLKNYKQSLDFHISILKKGKNVLIFPEGSRTKDGKLQPLKGGVVALAKYANAPIVPIAITGVWRATPKELLTRRRTVTIRFGKPIAPSELFAGYEVVMPQSFKKIANEKIMPRIAELIES